MVWYRNIKRPYDEDLSDDIGDTNGTYYYHKITDVTREHRKLTGDGFLGVSYWDIPTDKNGYYNIQLPNNNYRISFWTNEKM